MTTFDEFFRMATAAEAGPNGYEPHGYQRRVAHDGLPDVVQAATGTGKTSVILAWLWRRLEGPDRDGTPRRLVYALPQRSLVEQVAGEAGRWLKNLGLGDQVALHVVMGGAGKSQRQWRLDMHKPAIVVGTVDSLVSKALNRGYGIARATYPIDFALVTNGAHWVIDEIQLCPESTTTLRQLAAFAKTLRTAEPFGLTCMSATVPKALLETVDNPAVGDVLGIEPEERTGELAVRLNAARTIRRLAAEPGDYKAIAAAARDLHRPGTLTLVVLNTVDAARNVYKHLRGGSFERTLLHSRFRGMDRVQLMDAITGRSADRIVVATQVVEAGIDLNAAVLISEAAPWPSLVQRAGRCNRTGRVSDAELWWVPPVKPNPYPQPDIEAASAELDRLDGETVTGEDLLSHNVLTTETQVAVLRRSDFIALFDTAPDLSGADIDIAPYVRDADDLDVQLAWASWADGDSAAAGKAPPPEAKAPSAEYRCRIPLYELNAFLKRDSVTVWRLDQVLGHWTRVTSQARARPGEVLLVNAADGGYDPETGFDPAARGLVPDSPELVHAADPVTGAEDAYGADSASVAQPEWILLDRHSRDTRDHAEALLSATQPDLAAAVARSAVMAAFLHDVGKAHKIWQDALCALAPTERKDEIGAHRPWAKSDSSKPLRFDGSVSFRHEFASLLMLDGPLRDLLAAAPDPDLTRYLVLAHHGKLRVQVRDPGDLAVLVPGEASESKLLGLKEGSKVDIPPLLGQPATELTVDLDQFRLGGERSWTRTVLALRDRYGPFVLAYLESVVRIADWRASDPRTVKELAP
ncbi:MAG: type I-G CRISPR-associated helicase/endonuclease Cas3g [Streptosporangiaceae bacterium]